MKRMLVALMVAGAAWMVAGDAMAEPPGGDGMGPPHKEGAMKKFRAMRLAELQEALNLDDKTMLKLNEVLKKNDDKRDALHKEAREGMRQLKDLMDAQKPDEAKVTAALDKLAASRDKLHNIQIEQMNEARKLLTPIQQAKFVLHMDKFRKHMREMLRKSWQHHGQGPGPGPGGPGMGPGGGMGLGMGPGPDMPPPPPPDDDDDL